MGKRWRAWLVALISLAPSVASARGNARFAEEATGAIAAAGRDGGLAALPDATVRLSCNALAEPSEENQWHDSCAPGLRVERGEKLIASESERLLDFDYEKVAGNGGELSISLWDDGEAALIALTRSMREGDEWTRRTETTQLLIVDGKRLREVYRYQPLSMFDPGPDQSQKAERTEVALAVDSRLTRGVHNLIATTTSDDTPAARVLAWDGQAYAELATPPDEDKAAAEDRTSELDAVLAKVLAGQRIDKDSLRRLSTLALDRLRNAPYARHGRAFKKAALQEFFYAPRAGSKEKPLSVDPAFSDAMLDEIDRANVAAAVAEEKRRAAGAH